MINLDAMTDAEIQEVFGESIEKAVSDYDEGPAEEKRFLFGINVHHTRELPSMAEDIRDFIDTLGGGTAEIQVSVNAKLLEDKEVNRVIGFGDVSELAPAIGIELPPNDYDNEDEDYKLRKVVFE